ncbi:transglutaminase domain-containing protein [bacterium]|nr:transglutaminase domain-containing protein [bacterium]
MKYISILLVLLALSIQADWRETTESDSLIEQVEEALVRAGENKPILEEALESCDPSFLPGLIFLISNSPAINLAIFDKDSLLAEIELAYETRKIFSWGNEISDELFMHYVLPNQVSQEPATYYRAFFLEQLRPIVDTLTSGSEAALAVNKWCGEHVNFKQTQRQDQGVFHTLSSGYGRCEEMMIVFVSALRSVGIPAREAWTPYWATSDNNHAWTELHSDGDWHYAGSCEPSPTLDNAWFSKTSQRAAVIFSSAFGVPPKGSDILYREKKNYAIINSFPHYADNPAIVEVEVSEDSASIFLSVFNFGALRPIMRRVAEDNKHPVTFHIGQGDYILYTGNDSTFAWEKIHTEFGDTVKVILKPEQKKSLDAQAFWLRYPVPE